MAQHTWHLITGEYPPQPGGVGDYTQGLAAQLGADGDEVHVWCPGVSALEHQGPNVTVHRRLGGIGPRDLRRVGQELDGMPGPRRLLVQWVPHAYGYASMNVWLCLWLWARAARHGDRVEIVLHEPYLPFRWNRVRQSAAAAVHRLMTVILLRAAERVWITIPEWERRWRPYAFGRDVRFDWLPIHSNIPVIQDPQAVERIRSRYVKTGGLLIGHFGTFGSPIMSLLEPVLLKFADTPGDDVILLMGRSSHQYRDRIVHKVPALAERVHSAGALNASEISNHLAACDLMIQPYPDGVTTRRGTVMAGLCHGKPVVTTDGFLSENFWRETKAVELAPAGDTQAFLCAVEFLRGSAAERARTSERARNLYKDRFDIAKSVRTLRLAAGT